MSSKMIATIDLPTDQLEPELQYLRDVPRLAEVYDEFARGYWKNTVLWNQTADATDDRFRDCGDRIAATPHAANLPVLTGLLQTTFDFSKVLMVRARNLIDAVVLPHRDFTEMRRGTESYCRVFLPLEETPGAFHSDDAGPFSMRPGEIWCLDAKEIHTAVNFTRNSRVFICIDFAFDGEFAAESVFAPGSPIDPPCAPWQPARAPLPTSFDDLLASLGACLEPETVIDVLALLTKLHYFYDSEGAQIFDWLEQAVSWRRWPALAEHVGALRAHMVDQRAFGERFGSTSATTISRLRSSVVAA